MLKFINLIKKISTKKLQCDICGNMEIKKVMRQVFGGICVCYECINNILISYISSNPIKMLCPYCYDKEKDIEECKYCSIKLPKKDKDDEN